MTGRGLRFIGMSKPFPVLLSYNKNKLGFSPEDVKSKPSEQPMCVTHFNYLIIFSALQNKIWAACRY